MHHWFKRRPVIRNGDDDDDNGINRHMNLTYEFVESRRDDNCNSSIRDDPTLFGTTS